MRIAFIHPDLGIGGAERLVVDAALGLQEIGHDIVIYTSHCDKSHCFDEVRDGQVQVRVIGDDLPTNIGGKLSIFCAILRQLVLTRYILLHEKASHDAFIVDQLSACIPFLRRYSKAAIMFYCHFPDKLLARHTSLLRRIYRAPFDYTEALSTSSADQIVANSHFTQQVFHEAFPYIRQTPKVIYPCVDTTIKFHIDSKLESALRGYKFALSINRFERKKDIGLCVKAYGQLRDEPGFDKSRLILAGGYDGRVQENIDYKAELEILCDDLKLSHTTIVVDDTSSKSSLQEAVQSSQVIFMPSISDLTKQTLLSLATLLAYTPSHEHFGIVPIEAQLAGLPVLAVNTGGPLETVQDGKTGWLRSNQDINEWAEIMKRTLLSSDFQSLLETMKSNGPEQVKLKFSRSKMCQDIETQLDQLSLHSQLRDSVYWIDDAKRFFIMFIFCIIWIPAIILATHILG